MKESVDTLKLRLLDYKIKSGANLTIQPESFNLSKEKEQESIIYSDNNFQIKGVKAYTNDTNFNFTLDSTGAFLQMSVPKVFHANNELYCNGSETGSALKQTEEKLSRQGITTNLLNANLSRIDVFRQEKTDRTFNEYAPVFSLLQGKRQQKRDYGTTYLFHNTLRELCCYDKGVEKAYHEGLRNVAPTNDMRIENRLLKARSIKTTGLQTANDLLNNFDSITGIYLSGAKGIFTEEVKNNKVLSLGTSFVENELIQLRDIYKKLGVKEIRKFILRYGVLAISESVSIDNFINSVLRISDAKNKRDLKAKIDKIIKGAIIGIKAIPSKTSELYEELYFKFAV